MNTVYLLFSIQKPKGKNNKLYFYFFLVQCIYLMWSLFSLGDNVMSTPKNKSRFNSKLQISMTPTIWEVMCGVNSGNEKMLINMRLFDKLPLPNKSKLPVSLTLRWRLASVLRPNTGLDVALWVEFKLIWASCLLGHIHSTLNFWKRDSPTSQAAWMSFSDW